MNWLCKIGLHKWKPHYTFVNESSLWCSLFGNYEFISNRCQRCGKEVFEDDEPCVFDDYD